VKCCVVSLIHIRYSEFYTLQARAATICIAQAQLEVNLAPRSLWMLFTLYKCAVSGHHIWLCYRYISNPVSPTVAMQNMMHSMDCPLLLLQGLERHCNSFTLLSAAKCTQSSSIISILVTLLFAAKWVQAHLRHNASCRQYLVALSLCSQFRISIYAVPIFSAYVWCWLAALIPGNRFHDFWLLTRHGLIVIIMKRFPAHDEQMVLWSVAFNVDGFLVLWSWCVHHWCCLCVLDDAKCRAA